MSLSALPTPRPALPLRQVIFIMLSSTAIQIALVYFIHRFNGIKFGTLMSHPEVVPQLTVLPAMAAIAWIWFTAVWGQAGGAHVIGAVPARGNWIRLSLMAAIGCFIINVVFGNLMAGLMTEAPRPSIPNEILIKSNAFSLFVMALGVAVIAPIFEEILFRGILYGYLRNRLGLLLAAAIAAAIHAAFHGSLATLPGLFVVFLVFAYLYEKTGSIWAPCLAHGVHNLIVFAIGYAHATKMFA